MNRMNFTREEVMKRVYRVYFIKKISTKLGLFTFASIVGMSFVSTLDVLKNTFHAAAQLDLVAFFNYISSALSHTEGITYAAMTLSLTAIVLMLADLNQIRTKRGQYIEFM